MKIRTKNARAEVANSVRNAEEPAEEFGVESLNPRGTIAKQLEMSCRRSIALHKALMSMLDIQGNVQEVKYNPAPHGYNDTTRHLKDALGDEWWRTPTWRYGWEWLVDLWMDGGIRRGIDVTMDNMPSNNRKRVKKALREADMKAAEEMEDYIERYALGVR